MAAPNYPWIGTACCLPIAPPIYASRNFRLGEQNRPTAALREASANIRSLVQKIRLRECHETAEDTNWVVLKSVKHQWQFGALAAAVIAIAGAVAMGMLGKQIFTAKRRRPVAIKAPPRNIPRSSGLKTPERTSAATAWRVSPKSTTRIRLKLSQSPRADI